MSEATKPTAADRARAAGWVREVDAYGNVEWYTGATNNDMLACWDRAGHATSAACQWAVMGPLTRQLGFERDEDSALNAALALWGVA